MCHGAVPVPGNEHNAAIRCCQHALQQLPALPVPCLEPSLHLLPLKRPHLLCASSVSPEAAWSVCVAMSSSRMCSLLPKKVECHCMAVAALQCPARLELCGAAAGQGALSELVLLLQSERDSVEDMDWDMRQILDVEMEELDEEVDIDLPEEEEMEVEEQCDREQPMILG
ncbi:hypothetical protein WISP_133136 [Willisornis vidua]|uniref:Uncharacterized protein n=1 Tax=Willisornis vidua TaxID=1566151 RepID=A0ABQ9CP18_9PASS|nr:hypothetical protein WISP_133136 [Willisornis vidua]